MTKQMKHEIRVDQSIEELPGRNIRTSDEGTSVEDFSPRSIKEFFNREMNHFILFAMDDDFC